MIKLRLKRNLLYLLAFYIFLYARDLIKLAIKHIFDFSPSYLYLFMMTFGEIIGGATIYFYQICAKKQKKRIKYFGIKLIHYNAESQNNDGMFKKLVLLFFSSFFDIYEFIVINNFVPSFGGVSYTIDIRLGCLTTITSSLICTYALNSKIGKHHKFSLICFAIIFCLVLIIEFLFKSNDKPIGKFIFAHFLVFNYLTYISFTDCIEKYLVDRNFSNPFGILMIEGMYGFIMSIIYSINKNPLRDFIVKCTRLATGDFVFLVFFLFLCLLCSAILNAYRIYCNVIYSPMARSMADYFSSPLLNIYIIFWLRMILMEIYYIF